MLHRLTCRPAFPHGFSVQSRTFIEKIHCEKSSVSPVCASRTPWRHGQPVFDPRALRSRRDGSGCDGKLQSKLVERQRQRLPGRQLWIGQQFEFQEVQQLGEHRAGEEKNQISSRAFRGSGAEGDQLGKALSAPVQPDLRGEFVCKWERVAVSVECRYADEQAGTGAEREPLSSVPPGGLFDCFAQQGGCRGFDALMRGRQKVVAASPLSKAVGTALRVLPDRIKAVVSRVLSVPIER